MIPFSFLADIDNYEERKVEKNKVKGLVVSTAFSSDEGYETAIGDNNDWHPVERYESKEEYVQAVEQAVRRLVGKRLLLEDDVSLYVEMARQRDLGL